jgi:phosphate transport system substrate-binding protein
MHRLITTVLGTLLLLLTYPITATAALQATPEPGGAVTVAGSATLGPVLEAAAEAFAATAPGVTVEVERSSSGAGIERFCSGEVDIATSGRTMRDEEIAACEAAGIESSEFEVAFDGVAVVVHPDNAAVTCLTVDQLGQMWAPESTVATWADVDASLPDEPLSLYGTGEESGTYQFFTQVTVGEEGVSRDDYTVSDGHPATADAVAGDPNGLGFLPFPRYLDNQDRLKLVEVDGGEGCVAPSPETIQDGSYAPLSRPMYIYVSHASLARPEVQAYLTFWFADAAAIAADGGLVPSQDDVYATNVETLDALIAEGGATPVARSHGDSRVAS